MSHSVRRLWAGAIMLLMGCQAVPSGMTSALDAARTSMRTNLVRRPIEMAASPDDATNPAISEKSFVDEIPLPVDVSAKDDREFDETSGEQFPETPVDEPLWALTDDVDNTPPDSLEEVHSSDVVSDDELDASPIIRVSHEDIPTRRGPVMSDFGRSLEAPTPFSAIERKTAALEEPQPAPSHSDAENNDAVTGSGQAKDGFVDSLFDVFGIGGDRAGRTQQDSSPPLHRADVARLKRPPSGEVGAASTQAPTSRSEEVARSLQTIHWQEELDRLTALLETQLAHQKPGESAIELDYYIRQHVALRLLYLIGSRRPEALQAIPDCDPDQQEFWTELLWALSSVFDDEALPDQEERARETVDRLRAALTHLVPFAGLRLDRVQFCRQINGFGSFSAFEQAEFAPSQSVLVYVEVENFVSRLTANGEFVTSLQSTLRIQEGDTTGPIVFEEELPATEDHCLSRREDYFHSYRITLPPQLSPGPHVLTITMQDQQSQKIAVATVNFRIR